MQGDKRIDKLMLPVLNAINRHVKDIDAKTDIYNRAYEAVMISMVVKTSTTGVKTPESIENPWIPVSERLPEKRGAYYVYLSDDFGFRPDMDFFENGDWNSYTVGDVTHWMPLPEPPEGEA